MEELALQKPWMLSNTLSLLAMDDSYGMTPQEMAMHGIDIYFLLNAQLKQKPVIELEGTKAQVDMFDGLSPEAQEQSLVAVLDSILTPSGENQSEFLGEWFTSWKQGEVENFAKSFRAMEGESSEYNEMLFGLRDEQMAKKIMKLLEEKKRYVLCCCWFRSLFNREKRSLPFGEKRIRSKAVLSINSKRDTNVRLCSSILLQLIHHI